METDTVKRTPSRRWRTMVAGLLSTCALLGFAGSAQANGSWSEFLSPLTWGSWNSIDHTALHAFARYEGKGTVRVCEQTQAFNGESWNLISEICGDNEAVSGSLAPWSLYSKRTRVKNQSEFAHTIVGGWTN